MSASVLGPFHDSLHPRLDVHNIMFMILCLADWTAGNLTLESLNLGSNIKIINWAPQNDILGRPGVGVFLTQGGINSLYEAAYHAKPVVTIPLIADQEGNAVKVCTAKTLVCLLQLLYITVACGPICTSTAISTDLTQ